jgi:coenzyme F420 biosynthesis associated uncharacterized protein
VATRIAGAGPPIGPAHRAALDESLADVVAEAEGAVSAFTGLRIQGPPTRPWVMRRDEWIAQNLKGFEGVLEPVTQQLLGARLEGPMAPVRRKALAVQVGALVGYLARKVLGQYDLFLPPDDRDLLYFVGPNIVEIERRYRFPSRDFRLWLALHELSHRLQFDGVEWLRGYLTGLVDEYLSTLELDVRALLEGLRRARDEARRNPRAQEMGILFLLMTPAQRETFRKMQSLMSVLEGHGNFVMDRLSEGRVRDAARMRRTLQERRHRRGLERAMQRAVGIDVKIRQYDLGERFVAEAVALAGPDGFARVWESPSNLPTLEEIARPRRWVERVASG